MGEKSPGAEWRLVGLPKPSMKWNTAIWASAMAMPYAPSTEPVEERTTARR